MSATLLFGAVISVDAAWKTYRPSPSSVRVPVRPRVSEPYTPGLRVVPPSSVATFVTGVAPAASL